MQVYMPTTNSDDEEVLELYAEMQKIIDECPKKDRIVVMGDFNAQIGKGTIHNACGVFGHGRINARGELLLDWLMDNRVALNTCFRHRDGQRYTWVAPDGETRTQIDYIAVRQRDRAECLDSRTLRSADCGSDHQLVWAKLNGRAWKPQRLR